MIVNLRVQSGNTFSRLRATRREDFISAERNYPKFLLQEKGQSRRIKGSKRRPIRGRQIAYPIYDCFQVTGVNYSVENYADLFTVALRNDNIQEFDTRWNEILLSTEQFPPDDILESLYNLRI